MFGQAFHQPLLLGQRGRGGQEKGVGTTWFADVRGFLLLGYPRKPICLSRGAGWNLLYLRERGRERVLIAQHARELLWPVIR